MSASRSYKVPKNYNPEDEDVDVWNEMVKKEQEELRKKDLEKLKRLQEVKEMENSFKKLGLIPSSSQRKRESRQIKHNTEMAEKKARLVALQEVSRRRLAELQRISAELARKNKDGKNKKRKSSRKKSVKRRSRKRSAKKSRKPKSKKRSIKKGRKSSRRLKW